MILRCEREDPFQRASYVAILPLEVPNYMPRRIPLKRVLFAPPDEGGRDRCVSGRDAECGMDRAKREPLFQDFCPQRCALIE